MDSKKVFIGLVVVLFVLGSSFGGVINDQAGTIGLWHMDSITVDRLPSASPDGVLDSVADDDSVNQGRDSDLRVVGRGTVYAGWGDASITTGGLGVYGEALKFDRGDIAIADNAWAASTSKVYLDLMVKFSAMPLDTAAADMWIAYVSNTWDLYLNANNQLVWKIYNQSNASTGTIITTALTSLKDQWLHITASYDVVDGSRVTTLGVNDTLLTGTTAADMNLRATTHVILGGNTSKGVARSFVGMMDEVYVSTVPVPEPVTIVLLAAGLILSRKKGNF